MAVERWYYIKDGVLWKHTENDGAMFLRKRVVLDIPLCSLAEAPSKYPAELKKAQREIAPAVA